MMMAEAMMMITMIIDVEVDEEVRGDVYGGGLVAGRRFICCC